LPSGRVGTLGAVHDPSFGQEWGPLIAAGFAALAAIGSVISAVQARRTWRDSRRPQLTARLHALRGHPVLLRVRNIGGGPAKQIGFYMLIRDHFAVGDLPPDGYLAPGHAVSIDLHAPAGLNAAASRHVLMCLDRENNTYCWSREDEEKLFKRRWWRKKVRDIVWMFERFYGRGSARDGLTQIAWNESQRLN
jgi:hypothetical protein